MHFQYWNSSLLHLEIYTLITGAYQFSETWSNALTCVTIFFLYQNMTILFCVNNKKKNKEVTEYCQYTASFHLPSLYPESMKEWRPDQSHITRENALGENGNFWSSDSYGISCVDSVFFYMLDQERRAAICLIFSYNCCQLWLGYICPSTLSNWSSKTRPSGLSAIFIKLNFFFSHLI